MNISKGLLIVGLLVTGSSQAFTLSPESQAKAHMLYGIAYAQTQKEKDASVAECQSLVYCPKDVCEKEGMKAIVQRIKDSLKDDAKSAKDAYEKGLGALGSKESATALMTEYKIRKQAYHTYRSTLDKVFS